MKVGLDKVVSVNRCIIDIVWFGFIKFVLCIYELFVSGGIDYIDIYIYIYFVYDFLLGFKWWSLYLYYWYCFFGFSFIFVVVY